MAESTSLPVSPDTLHDEIVSSMEILKKLKDIVGVTGLPGIDRPGSSTECANLLRQIAGELMVVAGKCSNMASIIVD